MINMISEENLENKFNEDFYNDENTPEKIIKEFHHKKFKGEVIGKIACSHYYVHDDVRVEDLANELTQRKDILGLGVVDRDNKICGIIERREFFNTLSKPYGRDVYKYRDVKLLTKETEMFNYERNIFTVANLLSEQLYNNTTKYYILNTTDNKFAGVISTKDLLMYLSKITQNDVKLAKKIQNSIIQEEEYFKTNKDGEIFGTSIMAKDIGGDFYAIKKYNKTNWVIMIIDVSGKGIAASLVTAVIGGILGVYDFNLGLKQFIKSLNEYIYNTFQLEKYATGLFVDYNEKTGELTIFDLGHSHLYLYRNKTFSRLKTKNGNFPLGITLDMNPIANKLKLKEKDLMISFTDGVDEQTDTLGNEYNINNIPLIINKFYKQGLKTIKDEIFKDINNFKKNQPQHDDITMLFLNHK